MSHLDLLFPDRQRRPYYIVAPPYERTSAGIKVLHILCHLLNLQGHSAFMITGKVNPELTTPLLSEEIVEYHFQNKRTPIVVYPEVLHGNPLDAQCVVRYLLNLPGLLNGPSEFPPEDLLLWFSEEYRREAGGKGPILSIPHTDARFFRPPLAGTKRHGSCFYAAKYRYYCRGPLYVETENSIEILRSGEGAQTPEEILALFQKSEVFYCYESSALALEATLCGCPVVMLPNKHMDKLITCGPLGNAGIAWGTSEEELSRARSTVGEMRERYERWVEQSFSQLDEFIKLSHSRAMAIHYRKKVLLVDPFVVPPPPAENRLKAGLKRVVPKKTRAAIRKMFVSTHLS